MTADDAMPTRGVYAYCIGRSAEVDAPGPVGLGGETVRAVRTDGLAALVSNLPPGERVDAGLPSRASLLAHEFVTAAAMRRHTVVPVAYGTVFRSDADVAQLLLDAGPSLDAVLAAVADRVQVGVKVVRRAGCAADRARDAVPELYDAVRDVASAARARRPVGERMLVNAAFLVERAQLPVLVARVDALRGRREAEVEYRVSPLTAPYDFVRVRLRVDRGADVAGARGRA